MKLAIRDLRKLFATKAEPMVAVDGVDLDIHRGEIFALLGPNAAGTTTTVEIMEGYRPPDAREVSVLGLQPCPQRAHLKSRNRIVPPSPGAARPAPALTLRKHAGVRTWAASRRRMARPPRTPRCIGSGTGASARASSPAGSGPMTRCLRGQTARRGNPGLALAASAAGHDTGHKRGIRLPQPRPAGPPAAMPKPGSAPT